MSGANDLTKKLRMHPTLLAAIEELERLHLVLRGLIEKESGEEPLPPPDEKPKSKESGR